MKIDFAFDQAPPRVVSAFLLYGARHQYGGGTKAQYATVHDVTDDGAASKLLPGRLLTRSDIDALAKGLNSHEQLTHWVDASLLATGGGRLVWFTPPGKRTKFFDTSANSAVEIKGHGLLAVPGLVWMATGQTLYVYATKAQGRPEKDEQLYQAPFFNVWSRGKVCIGTASLPTEERALDPKSWEACFFGSRFTHPNFSEADRLLKGDPAKYWSQQLKRPSKVFDSKKLVEIPLTLDALVCPRFQQRISAIPKARGEF